MCSWKTSSNNSLYSFRSIYNLNIEELIDKGKNSTNGRSRLCLHKDNQSLYQVMLIYHDNNTTCEIHKHLTCPEQLIVLHGELKYNIYDNNFKCIHSTCISSESDNNGVHTDINVFHNIDIISKYVIFLEIVMGAFVQNVTEYKTI